MGLGDGNEIYDIYEGNDLGWHQSGNIDDPPFWKTIKNGLFAYAVSRQAGSCPLNQVLLYTFKFSRFPTLLSASLHLARLHGVSPLLFVAFAFAPRSRSNPSIADLALRLSTQRKGVFPSAVLASISTRPLHPPLELDERYPSCCDVTSWSPLYSALWNLHRSKQGMFSISFHAWRRYSATQGKRLLSRTHASCLVCFIDTGCLNVCKAGY
jgi:hypothetical protein